jgi:hypothetical protein
LWRAESLHVFHDTLAATLIAVPQGHDHDDGFAVRAGHDADGHAEFVGRRRRECCVTA